MPGESKPPEIDPIGDYPKMKWFGATWHAPVNDDCQEIPTPIGVRCVKCEQEILLLDAGFAVPYIGEQPSYVFYHRKCFLRDVLGPELAPIIESRMEEKENASQEPPS